MEAGMSECVAILEICAGNADVCGPVLAQCRRHSVYLVFETGLNPYDFRQPWKVPGLCFKKPAWIEEYLNSTEARELVAVPHDVHLNIVTTELNDNFIASGALAVDSISG
ncbi:hypothetical protein ColTof4_14539 [Colletotrichum tofieldiae]|nr:hypothetical protein ColTof3_13666 [Colletotrichum tofieldiae]GKT82116.1 hypothetical protein ColTof4_14539 [Colletotrichum tofieldiae]GKT95452.1 hypothetical protein Ct61P_13302 [Colletotrichum tofieldiae]